MSVRTTNPRTKICAMCRHWNGPMGGIAVKPRVNNKNFYEFDPEEEETCYNKHLRTKGWNSCSMWEQRY